jgi:hypothetical protein
MSDNTNAAKINAVGVMAAALITDALAYWAVSNSGVDETVGKCKSSYIASEDEREEATRFVQYLGITSEMRLNYDAYVDQQLAQIVTLEDATNAAELLFGDLLEFGGEVAEKATSIYTKEALQNMNTALTSDCMKPSATA